VTSSIDSPAARQWLARSLGHAATLTRIVPLAGSTSSSLYRVEATFGQRSVRAVLRLFTLADWLAREPDLAEHEAAVLAEAERAGLPAPRLIAFARDDAGFGVPAVLMTHIEGSLDLAPSRFRPCLTALAGTLAAIHRHTVPELRWRYRSWTETSRLAVPGWAKQRVAWERAIELKSAGAPAASERFIHRDYHPANLLWRGRSVAGVVDWVNGCRGPAEVDVAHCRCNLALMYDADAAEQFLDDYRAHMAGFDIHPYWDIDCVLDALPDPTYYEPWRHFGLGAIPQPLLRMRLEEHLLRIVDRISG